MLAAALVSNWDGVPQAQAGWVGLVVILLLALSVVFLYRSMNKQLKKIPKSFDEPPKTDDKAPFPPR
jgi:hypothetical protein